MQWARGAYLVPVADGVVPGGVLGRSKRPAVGLVALRGSKARQCVNNGGGEERLLMITCRAMESGTRMKASMMARQARNSTLCLFWLKRLVGGRMNFFTWKKRKKKEEGKGENEGRHEQNSSTA